MVGFPLLLIPLAVYNILVFLMPGVSLADTIVKVPLLSGTEWPVSLSDILLAVGILLLLLEVIKGARPGAKYVTDHLLSLIVFGAAAAEFLLWPQFATSVFCLLTLLALVDFLSGVALRMRRGVAVVATAVPAGKPVPRAEPIMPEPVPVPPAPVPVQPAPAVSPAVPAAASVAESVLMDPPEPKPAHPAAPSTEPLPGSSTPPPETPPR